jgi:hypothetical protein
MLLTAIPTSLPQAEVGGGVMRQLMGSRERQRTSQLHGWPPHLPPSPLPLPLGERKGERLGQRTGPDDGSARRHCTAGPLTFPPAPFLSH